MMKVPGHDLLHGVGGQGVDARQVHHGQGLVAQTGGALLLLHRHPGQLPTYWLEPVRALKRVVLPQLGPREGGGGGGGEGVSPLFFGVGGGFRIGGGGFRVRSRAGSWHPGRSRPAPSSWAVPSGSGPRPPGAGTSHTPAGSLPGGRPEGRSWSPSPQSRGVSPMSTRRRFTAPDWLPTDRIIPLSPGVRSYRVRSPRSTVF